MCGIVGMFSLGKKNITPKIKYSIHALNSRGQDACGIVVCDEDNTLTCHKSLGLVSQVLTDEVVKSMPGYAAVAQVRYSTIGSNTLQNAQPIKATAEDGTEIYLAHNGDITNSERIKKTLIDKGVEFSCTSDTEVIVKLLAYYYDGDMMDAIKKLVNKIDGAYSLVILGGNELYAIRDKRAIRPLLLGVVDDTYIIASEPYAFSILEESWSVIYTQERLFALTLMGTFLHI